MPGTFIDIRPHSGEKATPLLELAIRYAKKNKIRPRGKSSISRFGCILDDGRTRFYGWNSYKTCTFQALFSSNPERICGHAETRAIKQAVRSGVRDFSRYTLYVARVLADGTPALARPCTDCQKAITRYGINNVIHT